MADDGHRYKFGAPKGGWPSFGPDGKRTDVPEPSDEEWLAEVAEMVGVPVEVITPVGPRRQWLAQVVSEHLLCD